MSHFGRHAITAGQWRDVTAAVHLIGGWYDYYLRGILRDYATLKSAGQSPYLTIGPWFHANPNGMMTGLREGISWFEAHLKDADKRLRDKAGANFCDGRGRMA